MFSFIPSGWRSGIIDSSSREDLVSSTSSFRRSLTEEHLRGTWRCYLSIWLLNWIRTTVDLASTICSIHGARLMHLSLRTSISLTIVERVLMRVKWLFESIFLAPGSTNLVEQSLLTELFSLFFGRLWNYLHSSCGVCLWRSLKCFKTVWNKRRNVLWNDSLLLFVWIRFPEAEFGLALACDLETTCNWILFCCVIVLFDMVMASLASGLMKSFWGAVWVRFDDFGFWWKYYWVELCPILF